MNEALSAVTRLDGHHKHHVCRGYIRLYRGNGSSRLYRDPGANPETVYLRDCLFRVAVAFNVKCYIIRSRFGKELYLPHRVSHHEMNVPEGAGMGSYRIQYRASEGDVLNEFAVHNVEVEPFRSACVDACGCSFKIGKIGIEY